MPSRACDDKSRPMRLVATGSIPVNGSSQMSSLGFAISARNSSSRLRSPPDSSPRTHVEPPAEIHVLGDCFRWTENHAG